MQHLHTDTPQLTLVTPFPAAQIWVKMHRAVSHTPKQTHWQAAGPVQQFRRQRTKAQTEPNTL
jgi:hypothetical protein